MNDSSLTLEELEADWHFFDNPVFFESNLNDISFVSIPQAPQVPQVPQAPQAPQAPQIALPDLSSCFDDDQKE